MTMKRCGESDEDDEDSSLHCFAFFCAPLFITEKDTP